MLDNMGHGCPRCCPSGADKRNTLVCHVMARFLQYDVYLLSMHLCLHSLHGWNWYLLYSAFAAFLAMYHFNHHIYENNNNLKTSPSARCISTNAAGAVKTMCNALPPPLQRQHLCCCLYASISSRLLKTIKINGSVECRCAWKTRVCRRISGRSLLNAHA